MIRISKTTKLSPAAGACAKRAPADPPHLILVPERPFQREAFLAATFLPAFNAQFAVPAAVGCERATLYRVEPDGGLRAWSSDGDGRVWIGGSVARFDPATETWGSPDASVRGAGIAPDNIKHLFDLFWQAEKGERRGAGLGLPIARNIFRVPRVIARLYDPRRAGIYRRLGLLTISSTTWGAERIRELLTVAELIRFRLDIGRLAAAAIERGARARYMGQ